MRKWMTFSYTTNVRAHAGVTLQKIKTNKLNQNNVCHVPFTMFVRFFICLSCTFCLLVRFFMCVSYTFCLLLRFFICLSYTFCLVGCLLLCLFFGCLSHTFCLLVCLFVLQRPFLYVLSSCSFQLY